MLLDTNVRRLTFFKVRAMIRTANAAVENVLPNIADQCLVAFKRVEQPVTEEIAWAIDGLVAPDLSSLVNKTVKMVLEIVNYANRPWLDCTINMRPAIDFNPDYNTGGIASDWVMT